MSAFDFFDHVYCVNLPNLPRLNAMLDEFHRVGIAGAQFLHAKPPPALFSMSNFRRNPRDEFGASLSHLKTLVHAIAQRAEQPLFVEDDIAFVPEAESRLTTALAELPADWDLLYFGGHPREPVIPVNGSWVQVGAFSFAEAYCLRGSRLIELCDYWCDRAARPNAMFDFVLGEFAATHRAYCLYPLLCEQPPGFSQIQDRQDDKRILVARGWTRNLSRDRVSLTHQRLSTQ
jgi:hypothetical protein